MFVREGLSLFVGDPSIFRIIFKEMVGGSLLCWPGLLFDFIALVSDKVHYSGRWIQILIYLLNPELFLIGKTFSVINRVQQHYCITFLD